LNVLVIFDSKYGNTEIIARAVGEAIDADVLPLGWTEDYRQRAPHWW